MVEQSIYEQKRSRLIHKRGKYIESKKKKKRILIKSQTRLHSEVNNIS